MSGGRICRTCRHWTQAWDSGLCAVLGAEIGGGPREDRPLVAVLLRGLRRDTDREVYTPGTFGCTAHRERP